MDAVEQLLNELPEIDKLIIYSQLKREFYSSMDELNSARNAVAKSKETIDTQASKLTGLQCKLQNTTNEYALETLILPLCRQIPNMQSVNHTDLNSKLICTLKSKGILKTKLEQLKLDNLKKKRHVMNKENDLKHLNNKLIEFERGSKHLRLALKK